MLKLTFHGHACFTAESEKYKVVIDPFFTGNPVANTLEDSINVNAVLVTHGHADHLGDAVSIAKRCKAPIIAPFELAMYVARQGAEFHPMHLGGTHKFEFGSVRLTFAMHGSAFVSESGAEYTGNPCGFVVEMDGKTFYHAGDTGLFSDMKLIGELNPLDVAILPIGDNFTMGPSDAAIAVEMLKPKLAIPMHYNTWDIIAQNPEEFSKRVEAKGFKCKVLGIDESVEIV